MEIKFYRMHEVGGFSPKRNQVYKSLIPSTLVTINGEFRDSIDLSNPTIIIDISNTANIASESTIAKERFISNVYNAFNYVYIPLVSRYYFVTKITLLRKNIISIDLHVDVLMSFKDFIYNQNAFVSRNKTNYNILLPDERRIVTNELENILHELVDITTPELHFDTSFGTSADVTNSAYNFIVIAWEDTIDTQFIEDDSGIRRSPLHLQFPNMDLPIVRPTSFAPKTTHVYCLNREELATLIDTMTHGGSHIADAVSSIFAFPIKFNTLYVNAWSQYETDFKVLDTTLMSGHKVHDIRDLLTGYITIGDFEIPNVINDFNDLEPYSEYQLYIPYYGYYKLNYNMIHGHRIIAYMSINYEIGNATILLFDTTDNQLITSLESQIGIEIPKTYTNIESVRNRHDANNTSLVLGLIASVISVVGGIVTGGAGAVLGVAGGTLAGAKSIGTYTMSEKTNLESASRLNYNGNTAPLFSPQDFYIKQVKRKIQYSLTTDFLEQNGGVINELYTLSTLRNSGYTEIADIPNINYGNVDNIPTDTEVDEIIRLLKSGVIL